MSNYYYNYNNSAFHPCHDSCKKCQNADSCEICKNNYYFKEEEMSYSNHLCYTSTLKNYYLDINVNISFGGEKIKAVYKKCHPHCKYCISSGTDIKKNCTECETGILYKYDINQCTQDKDVCMNKNQLWKLENNNIQCITNLGDCRDNIVLYGNNKGQCVKDCRQYTNPYAETQ